MECNDSIMNDDVRKALQQERTDHMAYLPGMMRGLPCGKANSIRDERV